MSSSHGFVVLFGSAANGATNPRDLDVVVAGSYSEADATAAARAWWLVEHGGTQVGDSDQALLQQVRATPPPAVEVTRHQGDGPVHLLRPRGAETTVILLRGEAEVRWTDVDSLPAAIRLATDGHPEAAAEMISRLRVDAMEGDTWRGRVPLSLAPFDKARPIGVGGYEGDGPVALEQALARTGEESLLPLWVALGLTDSDLPSLLAAIRAAPGVWSGRRWKEGEEPGLMAGLRAQWVGGTPLGCRGYVGATDVLFEYAPILPIGLISAIVESYRGVLGNIRERIESCCAAAKEVVS